MRAWIAFSVILAALAALAACSAPTPARVSPPPVASVASVAPPRAPSPPRPEVDSVEAHDVGGCPDGEVYVPPTGAEGFTMGRGTTKDDAPHRVVLTRGFCMDENEVSGRDWARCVEAGACSKNIPLDEWSSYHKFPDNPVNMTTWGQARGYCAWAGKRLPTEAEWEWAASGPNGSAYPWGDSPEPNCEYVDYTPGGAPKWRPSGDVGCHGGGPSAVGAHPKGDKIWPGGHIHDLAGNVWEWCEDSFESYSTAAAIDPLVRRETAIHVLRGGGWNRPANAMHNAFRAAAIYDYQVPGVGFRCVRGEPHATPPPRQKTWR